MDDELDRAFWDRQLRVSNVLNLGVVVVNLTYTSATWSTGEHRAVLLALNLVVLAGVVAAMIANPAQRVAASAHRDLVFGSWCVMGSILVMTGVALDGGLESPLAWLFPISIMFTAMVHRPRLVILSAATSIAGYAAVAVAEARLADEAWSIGVRGGYLVALGYAGAMNAHFRWNQHDAQAELRDQLAALADRDGLTGLYNHRAFHVRLRAELADAERYGTPVTLLVADLDHFKQVNDEHGHPVGDQVLLAAAGAIAGMLRESDVIARVGGEEFCVALPNTDPATGAAIAERLRRAIADLPGPVRVTTSVGLCSYPAGAGTASALLDGADRALYEAKRAGRNLVRCA